MYTNLINFSLYLLVSIPLMIFGILMFTRTTSYNDFDMINAGSNTHDPGQADAAIAVACDLGGKIIGLSTVLASAIFHSANLIELTIWGLVGILFEIIIFCFFRLLSPIKVTTEISGGNIAVGIFSAVLSISSGLLMAALIS